MMIMARFYLCLLAATVVLLGCSAPLAKKAGEPEKSNLTYKTKPDNENYVYVEGEVVLEGTLLAYWDAQYTEAGSVTLAEAKPKKKMRLRFYPDAISASRLPSFALSSGGSEKINRIFLYRDRVPGKVFDRFKTGFQPSETDTIKEALAVFDAIPDGFLEYREGYVTQPVSLALQGMVSFVEGNHRFTYAQPQRIEAASTDRHDDSEIPDMQPDTFKGRPWVETFHVAQEVSLKERPSSQSRDVAQLDAGTYGIEKKKTVNEEWVLVEVEANDSESKLTGYIEASKLRVTN